MHAHRTIHGRLWLLLVAGLILATLGPIGATLARSGLDYHLTTLPPAAGESTSSGGSYVLTQIETTISSARSRAGTYTLAPLTGANVQGNICVYLPITVRGW